MDEQGAAVGFTTVTVTSTAMQGARTASAGADGTFGFWQLPPGEFEIKFEAPRFAPAIRTARVPLGRRVELLVVLSGEGVPEAREAVPESRGLISGPPLSSHVVHDALDTLAAGRTPFEIAQLSPGVTANVPNPGQVSIHGASGTGTLFVVNGVDVTDNVDGSAQDLFVEDAIAETATITSGIAAEYGRFNGGIVSAVTRSGGNRFSGSYRVTLSNPQWTMATPLERCELSVAPAGCVPAPDRPDILRAVHEGTVGGFLVRDRLWFFTAGRIASRSSTTILPASGVSNAETGLNRRGQIKITGAVSAGHTVTFDTAANRTTATAHPSLAFTADPAAVADRTTPNYYTLASYQGRVGKRAFVEGQFAQRRYRRYDGSASSGNAVDSPMFSRTILADGSPVHYNAPYFDPSDPEGRNSVQAGGQLTYLLEPNRSGSHELRGGYEFYRGQRVGGLSQSATGFVYDTDYLTGANGTTPVADAYGRFIPLFVPGKTLLETWLPARGAALDVDTQSIHVQDRWTTSRLTADIGLRHERVRSQATGSFVGIRSDRLLPRLAAGYRLDGSGTRVIRATYGRYAGRYEEARIGRDVAVANPDRWLGVYFGPLGQGRSFAAGFDPANYITIAGRFPSSNVSVDSAVRSPTADEITASYGMELLNGRGFVQTAYVQRDWDGFIDDDISIADGTKRVIRSGFNVGTFTNVVYRNHPEAARNYRALEFQGSYRLRRDWRLDGSYTVQLRNEGNYVGEEAGNPAATSPIGDYPEIFTPARHYPSGRLPTFERSRARVWTTYVPDRGRLRGLSLSVLLRGDSAAVYDLAAIDQPLTDIQNDLLAAAGYPDRPRGQNVFFGNRGSETFNGYALVDLAVGYSMPFVGSLRPWLKLEIYNALNNQKQIGWDTTVYQDPASPVDDLGLHTGYLKAATFGKATSNADFPVSFQGDTGGRTLRVAAGIRF